MSKYTEYMCGRADYAAWLGSVASHVSQESFDVVDHHDQVHKVIKDFNSYKDVQKLRESTESHSGE